MIYTVPPNDSPARIAHKLTGNPARASELVSVNAHKSRAMIAGQTTFQTLHIGEPLLVPTSPGWPLTPAECGNSGCSQPASPVTLPSIYTSFTPVEPGEPNPGLPIPPVWQNAPGNYHPPSGDTGGELVGP